jgi:hypothetical protein
MQMHDIEAYERVSGGHRIMWAQGRATEKHIREGVIATREGNAVWGVWKCKCEAAFHEGTQPPETARCNTCRQPLTTYHEPVLKDDDHMLTGSPDLTLVMPRNYLLVNEIKSMTPDMFDVLERPQPDHAHQGLMYRDMYRRQGFNVMDHVAIIYGRKQFKWGGVRGINRVYKEYHVDANSRVALDMVAASYETADRIRRHTAGRVAPERRECSAPDSTKAKKCPVAHLCFSMR